MISTIPLVTTSRFCSCSVRRCFVVAPFTKATIIGNVKTDGKRSLYSQSRDRGINSCTHTRQKKITLTPNESYSATIRNYSLTFSKPKNNTNDKSREEHHLYFKEQLLELEREQKQFGQNITDEDNSSDSISDHSEMSVSSSSSSNQTDLQDQLNDWKSEQLQVFGEQLVDHEDGPSIPNNNNNGNNNVTGLEPEERESRFEFTPEDMAAWGKPNPNPEDMQKILDQVTLEREKEAAYAQSASLSPSPPNKSQSDGDSYASQSQPQSTPVSGPEQHESFSHVSGDGSSVHMVDVGHKAITSRIAHARSEVWLPPDVLEAFSPGISTNEHDDSSSELVGPKGPIFATAKIAGIMACKKTSDLIPLCHPLPLDQVVVDIQLRNDSNKSGGTVVIDCICKVTHKTGVEMEALTGATVAALTIYDMTKAVSHDIRIQDTRLIGKRGGKRTVENKI